MEHRLGLKYPDLVHVEENTLIAPQYDDFDPMFKQGHLYNWSQQYSTHVWKRFGPVPTKPEDIEKLNSTLGQMMRFVYFGHVELAGMQNTSKLGLHT